MKTVLFYSNVKDRLYFETQRFYRIDILLLEELGYKVIVSNKLQDFIFKSYNFSFIYFYRKGAIGALLSRLRGKKVFFTGGIDELEENIATSRNYRIQKWLFKICRFLSTQCIIVSNSDLENIEKIYHGSKPAKLKLSFHTIDVDKFIPQSQDRKECFFLTIAWMATKANVLRKGVPQSLLLFKYLIQKPEFSNYKYVIIGKKGEGSLYLEECISKWKLYDNVIFTDAISEDLKIDYLKKSYCYFQLSTYEGFGIAALEALASRNIVIHSAKGGLKDSMKDYGIIVNIDSLDNIEKESVYSEIVSYEHYKLDNAACYIKLHFSNECRSQVLKKLLKE